jgi:hypothetical protein
VRLSFNKVYRKDRLRVLRTDKGYELQSTDSTRSQMRDQRQIGMGQGCYMVYAAVLVMEYSSRQQEQQPAAAAAAAGR